MPPDLERDATLAADLVREAGGLAYRMRDEAEAQQKSSPGDLVTAADRAAEAHLVARLRAERPEDGVLGEEGADRSGGSGRTWVIDPVDGTFNYVRGLTWWCSALALSDADGALLGAVHHPHDDVVWVGGRDRPTTRNGTPVARLRDRPLAECALTAYIHTDDAGVPDLDEPFAALLRSCATFRSGGAGSLDLAAVAEGSLDLWCQQSVAAWDRLPGQALVEGAGGRAADVEVRGYTWSLAGPAAAVDEAIARLRSA